MSSLMICFYSKTTVILIKSHFKLQRRDFYFMDFLYQGILTITLQQLVMYGIGFLLIYLAIKKDFEPALLLPMGFGAIGVIEAKPSLSALISDSPFCS